MDIKLTKELRDYLNGYHFIDKDEVTMAVQDFFFPDAGTDGEEPSYWEVAECQEVAEIYVKLNRERFPEKKWWRWVEGVEMIWHWTNCDPELEYKWIVANYYEIEDSLYESFKDCMEQIMDWEVYKVLSEEQRDYLFNGWLKEHMDEIEETFENANNFNP